MIQIVRHIEDLKAEDKGAVMALGNFDGIHLGHQELIKKAKEIAKKEGKKLALLSFFPHPITFFKNTQNIRVQSLREKMQILDDLGVDLLFMQRFSLKFSQLSAENFIKEFLLKGVSASHIIVGDDFTFGYKRRGSAGMLEEKSHLWNYSVNIVALQKEAKNAEIYSSTNIRNYLTQGDVESASKILGRPYTIIAKVIAGRQEARELGFKTANMLLGNLLHPRHGVYAANVYVQGIKYQAVVNFGIRPTFNVGNNAVVEAHIFDLAEDIYGTYLKLELISFLRPEKKFPSLSELKEQIAKDVQNAKQTLNNEII